MALPVTITGISTAVATVGPFKAVVNSYVARSEEIFASSSSSDIFGQNINARHRGQTFVADVSYNIGKIRIDLIRTGSPADNLQIVLYNVVAGVPSGASIGTSQSLSGVTTTQSSYTFTFATPVSVVSGNTYAWVVQRTGAVDSSNYYRLYGSSGAITDGLAITYDENASTWAPSTDTGGQADYGFTIHEALPVDAFYFFGRDGTTATTLQAYKSTAPDTSWSSIATKTGFTTAILNLAACQVGSVVHILVQDGTASTSLATKYVSFDTSTDTFLATTETVSAAVAVTGQIAGAGAGASLVVRSDGSVVTFYSGVQTKTSGTFRSRVYYRIRTALNTYGTETEVDANTAVDNNQPVAVLGTSDRVHFLFFNQTNTHQRHLTSANSLGTAASTGATTAMQDVCRFDDVGTIRHVGFTAAQACRWNSADNPTVTAASITTGTPVRTVDDDFIIYALYQNSADSDLYIKGSSDDGATFGSATNIFTGTVASAAANLSKNQTAYQRGSTVVFPYVVNDNGTLKYNEYIVRAVGISFNPARVNLALSGTAPTSVLVIPSNPARRDLALSTTAPSASVGAPGINISPARVDLAISGSQAAVGTVKGLNAADLIFSTTAPTAQQAGAIVAASPARVDLALSPTAPTSILAVARDPVRVDLALTSTVPTSVRAIPRDPLRVDLALTPTAPTSIKAIPRDPARIDLVLSPTAPTSVRAVAANIPQGNLALTATAPAVSVLSGLVISPARVDLAISPSQPAIGTAKDLNAAGLTISTTAPSVALPGAGTSINPPAVNLAISSLAPDAGLGSDIPIGQLAISTTAPTRLVVGAGIGMSPARVDLAISRTAPIIVATAHYSINPARVDLAISRTAPTVTVSAANNTTITPNTRDLVISCTAPTALVTIHASVAPSTRDLVLSTTAPSVALAVTSCIILPPSVNLLLSTTAASSIRTVPPPRQFVRYVRPMTHIMRRW